LSDRSQTTPDDGLDHKELFENAPCAYLLVSKGRIVGANATAAAWFGTSPADLREKRLSDMMTFGGRMYWETHLSPLLRLQGRVDGVALDFLGPNGSSIPTFASASEQRDADGRAIAVRLLLFRAMERRQYEQALVAARKAADEAMTEERQTAELREQFIAVLGHDLRNPLAAFTSGLRMLRKEELTDRGQKLTDLMEGSVSRMLELIDNVLDFARARLGGGINVTRDAHAPLSPVLLQVVQEIQSAWMERTITTAIDLDEPVDCDRARIAQMVSNLLANAITHGADDIAVHLSAATDGSHLEIAITNGGEQIPPEAMERLFQPFFRGEVRPSQQGLGLGLHIASEIAKAHGGTLEAASTTEETRFTFRMPLWLGSAVEI
jgi:sigma-B regulation protein RsbU (phosphoserine phosphatase)